MFFCGFKVFSIFFFQNQSEVCVSGGLEATALQTGALICWNAFSHRDCGTGMTEGFTQTDAISKLRGMARPDWRQTGVNLKGFQVTYNFVEVF